jgi:FkbM family methyltransferase
VDLYKQEPEARLLGALLARLEVRSVIDVGAERGAFTEALLSAGATEVHAIEPEPDNAASIRKLFAGDPRVSVHECAVGDVDGELELHKSVDPSGAPITFGHTVLERRETDEIAWAESLTVKASTLASLAAAGEIPARVGIVKIDTEGHDLTVVSGLGELECDVLMVEHWSDLPHSLGPCPWSPEQMVSALHARGFSHFAFFEHLGEFVILKWDDATVPHGYAGNLVFLHDRVLERVLPQVLECASSLATSAVEVGRAYETAASERLVVIEGLERDRDEHAAAAAERLALIEVLERECELRLELIEKLSSQRLAQRR